MSPSCSPAAPPSAATQQEESRGAARPQSSSSHRRRSLTSLAALTAACCVAAGPRLLPSAGAFVTPSTSTSDSGRSMLLRHAARQASRRTTGALSAFLLPSAASPLSTAAAAAAGGEMPNGHRVTAFKPSSASSVGRRATALKASSYGRGGGGRGGGYRGGGGRGRSAPVDEFGSFGEQMDFDTTINADDHVPMTIADKRVSPAVRFGLVWVLGCWAKKRSVGSTHAHPIPTRTNDALQVVEALAACNITSFTPIQEATYDSLYDGRDMIGAWLFFGFGLFGGWQTDWMAGGLVPLEHAYTYAPTTIPSPTSSSNTPLHHHHHPHQPTTPGRSRTGTGKTLAFGLPILEVVAKNLEEEGSKSARGR